LPRSVSPLFPGQGRALPPIHRENILSCKNRTGILEGFLFCDCKCKNVYPFYKVFQGIFPDAGQFLLLHTVLTKNSGHYAT